MGRIKTTLVKRTARQVLEKSPESFAIEFEKNKKALGRLLPSKRVRNMVAGYVTRLKRNTKKIVDARNLNEQRDAKDDNSARN